MLVSVLKVLPNSIFLASQSFNIYKRLLGICSEKCHDHHVIENCQKTNLSSYGQYLLVVFFGRKLNLFNMGRSDLRCDFDDLEALLFCLDDFFAIYSRLDFSFWIT